MRNYFVILCSLLIPCCYAATSFQQTITTTIPAAVNVTAINTSSAQGTIDPVTGNSSSPAVSFRLQTNGADSNYTYVVQSTLQTSDNGSVNAYAQLSSQGYIMLGNNSPTLYPSAAAVNDIKSGTPNPVNNSNVIAYPVTNTLNNLASATLTNNPTYGGLCYIVKTGTSKDGTLVQTIGSVPLANTYSIANDRAGVYQAIVTFSANRNP